MKQKAPIPPSKLVCNFGDLQLTAYDTNVHPGFRAYDLKWLLFGVCDAV